MDRATLTKLTRAETCSYSKKQIQNRSVYCTLNDLGWISINYCELCLNYEKDLSAAQASREEIVDSSGPIIADDKGIVNDTKEAEESLMRIEEKEHG